MAYGKKMKPAKKVSYGKKKKWSLARHARSQPRQGQGRWRILTAPVRWADVDARLLRVLHGRRYKLPSLHKSWLGDLSVWDGVLRRSDEQLLCLYFG